MLNEQNRAFNCLLRTGEWTSGWTTRRQRCALSTKHRNTNPVHSNARLSHSVCLAALRLASTTKQLEGGELVWRKPDSTKRSPVGGLDSSLPVYRRNACVETNWPCGTPWNSIQRLCNPCRRAAAIWKTAFHNRGKCPLSRVSSLRRCAAS